MKKSPEALYFLGGTSGSVIFKHQKIIGCKTIAKNSIKTILTSLLDSAMLGLAALYLILIALVYRFKDHPGVRSRSPLLIITGGLALLADSMMNFMIQLSDNAGCQCFIGIFTTVVFHYAAWFSIYLRAHRIGKFFDIYERYLDTSEKQQMMSSELRLTLPTVEFDAKYEEEEDVVLKEFDHLRE